MRENLRSNLDYLQAPDITRKDRLLILTLIELVEAIDTVVETLEDVEASLDCITHHLGEFQSSPPHTGDKKERNKEK